MKHLFVKPQKHFIEMLRELQCGPLRNDLEYLVKQKQAKLTPGIHCLAGYYKDACEFFYRLGASKKINAMIELKENELLIFYSTKTSDGRAKIWIEEIASVVLLPEIERIIEHFKIPYQKSPVFKTA